MFQRDLSEGLHDPVFQSWIAMALLTGQVVMDGGTALRAARLDKFQTAAFWRGRGWESVNPKDDATANEKDLANRTKAPSDIAAARGEDFEDLAERYARDLETLAARGIPLSATLAGQPPQPSPPDVPTDGSGEDTETET